MPGGIVNGNVPVNGDKMKPTERITVQELTVKNVKKILAPYNNQCITECQQLIAFFGVSPKLERILWAYVHKDHLAQKRWAEEQTYGEEGYDGNTGHDHLEKESGKMQRKVPLQKTEPKPQKKIVEPPAPTEMVGICPKCSGTLVGASTPSCSKTKKNAIYYKECKTCTFYMQMWSRKVREKTTYFETEGG
jgi:transcription elongation factor Elf1